MYFNTYIQLYVFLQDNNIQLLPEVEQEKVKNGERTELPLLDDIPRQPDYLQKQNTILPSTLLFQMSDENPIISTIYGTPQGNSDTERERGMSMLKSISKRFKFDDINTTTTTTPLKEFNRGSSRIQKNKHQLLQNGQNDLTNSARSSRFGRRDVVEAYGDLMDISWR